jgi:uncharacterized membrane protein YidH (DUF202 family)
MLYKILIDVRDFSYHYCKKHYGAEKAKSEYLLKLMGFLAFYYLSALILLAQVVVALGKFQMDRNMSLFSRLIIGILLVGIPMWLLVQNILRWTNSTPIQDEVSLDEYRRLRKTTLAVLFFGGLVFLISIVAPIYFMGGTIQIGKYVIQRK